MVVWFRSHHLDCFDCKLVAISHFDAEVVGFDFGGGHVVRCHARIMHPILIPSRTILIFFQKGKNEPTATLFFSLLLLLLLSLRGVTSVTPILVTLQSEKTP